MSNDLINGYRTAILKNIAYLIVVPLGGLAGYLVGCGIERGLAEVGKYLGNLIGG